MATAEVASPPGSWISARRAARILKCTEPAVVRLAERGVIGQRRGLPTVAPRFYGPDVEDLAARAIVPRRVDMIEVS